MLSLVVQPSVDGFLSKKTTTWTVLREMNEFGEGNRKWWSGIRWIARVVNPLAWMRDNRSYWIYYS